MIFEVLGCRLRVLVLALGVLKFLLLMVSMEVMSDLKVCFVAAAADVGVCFSELILIAKEGLYEDEIDSTLVCLSGLTKVDGHECVSNLRAGIFSKDILLLPTVAAAPILLWFISQY
jgi:hypothetical protein